MVAFTFRRCLAKTLRSSNDHTYLTRRVHSLAPNSFNDFGLAEATFISRGISPFSTRSYDELYQF
jgi:hypothetical protein